MEQEKDFSDIDESSDSDFCLEKDTPGSDFSEASSEESSCNEESSNDENADSGKKKSLARKKTKLSAKKAKPCKRSRAPKKPNASTDSDDDESIETCRRNTRQTDLNRNGRQKGEKDKIDSDEDDKTRTDALWADFLNDVGGGGQTKAPKSRKETTLTEKQCDNGTTSNDTSSSTNQSHEEESDELKKTKPVIETATAEEPVQIRTIHRFAEEVSLERVINADSVKENKANTPQRTSNFAGGSTKPRTTLPMPLKRSVPGTDVASTAGLGSILGQIGKKKKVSVLEKSKLDWNSFKKDEGIEEELHTFNKGKDGYLERQDFMQRTDLRQFEIEKGLRQLRRNQ